MNKYIKPVLIGVIVLLIAIFVVERSCDDTRAKLFELKGQFQELEEKAKKDKQEDEEIILRKDTEIGVLKEENKKIDRERIDLERKDDESQDKIYRLELDATILEDKDSIIANKDEQIKQWKIRFWNERADKDKVSLLAKNWASAYSKENQIRKMLEKQLADRDRLLEVAKAMVAEQEKTIKGMKFRLSFKNILYTGAAFGAGFVLGGLSK